MSKKAKDSLELVYLAKGRLDGEMVRSFLEAQGIPAISNQEAVGDVYGFTVGDLGMTEIMVHSEDALRARELLNAMEDGDFSNEILIEDNDQAEALGPQSVSQEADLQARQKVLILCTGNSARSQMAEAVANQFCWDTWVAYSAGTQPAEQIHPLATAALEELGIFHQGEPKSVEVFRDETFDLVITVCDKAREACPLWLGKSRMVHVGFEDPAAVQGSDVEKMAAFRECLRLISATIPAVLEEYQGLA